MRPGASAASSRELVPRPAPSALGLWVIPGAHTAGRPPPSAPHPAAVTWKTDPNQRRDRDRGGGRTRPRGPAPGSRPLAAVTRGRGQPGTQARSRRVSAGRRGSRPDWRQRSRGGAEGAGRWRGAGRAMASRHAARHGFRLWPVQAAAAAGSGLSRRLGALPALPEPGARLQSSCRRRGRNDRCEGPGRADPFLPQCERRPEPRSGEAAERRGRGGPGT